LKPEPAPENTHESGLDRPVGRKRYHTCVHQVQEDPNPWVSLSTISFDDLVKDVKLAVLELITEAMKPEQEMRNGKIIAKKEHVARST
jgi:hypothetical protein